MKTKPAKWICVGSADKLKHKPLQQIVAGKVPIALSCRDGQFGAISGVCTHAGGPLGDGRLTKDGFVVCPWHNWDYECQTGKARPGSTDTVPSHDVKIEGGDVWVNAEPGSKRVKSAHPAHPLTREIRREPGPLRVAGISTTAMSAGSPRFSTSENLLQAALDHAEAKGAKTRLLKVNELKIRTCEGYYSKGAGACTWPCSITQQDEKDEMTQIYEALVFWADVVLVSTSIRWGAPSSPYFKMVERLNCVQNQVTTHDKVLIRNKTAAFIITGGQDNVQSVAGQMMMFFGEIGFTFPQFPFVAHSRGWSAEDMENNVAYVKEHEELRDGARALTERCLAMAEGLVARGEGPAKVQRGGRKAGRR
ncbi:MAG: NAD(P)H-dependent oxidoreductase [Planctomycetes bacterium]|nr:NAD(P)H-dependent oxidoreductase [Planctomycetota bacterium]